jgi:hypothetical protein
MSKEQRHHARVGGPFDGYRVMSSIETPIRIYDLSEGGCFINWDHAAPEPGKSVVLRIALPGEGWVTVAAEAVHARPGGFAVRFTELTADDFGRLQRVLERLR